MAVQAYLAPKAKHPRSQAHWISKRAAFHDLLRINFDISTWLLLGALIQSLVVVLIPRIYALLPVVLVLLVRFANTMAITFGFKANPYLKDAVLHRLTPQIPDADGQFSDEASNEKVTVLFLGFKCNHHLGIFAPNLKNVVDLFTGMVRQLEKNPTEHGFYGGSQWVQNDKNGAMEILFISYWRSADDVHRYAYGDLHRKTWDWWISMDEKNKHLGINHEIYEVDRRHWEAVYVNFQPTNLGATTYLQKGDKMVGGTVEDRWIHPLIDARRGKWRTSSGRLGRQTDALKEKFGYDGYGPDA
ncbi:hypothetical protein B0A52_08954 [Exophiala mesophila]|uniref:Uncharacterized protein n=1 Tax=Exophiala mesophila TaxID=212818 RepID=A0A438MT04_EXOME|nr:hypothetical protein B0A52_08954 [Exophiala mesophila]